MTTTLPNIDTETGIAYGVISFHSVKPEWLDDVYTKGENLSYKAALADLPNVLRLEGVEPDSDEWDERHDFFGENFQSDGDDLYRYEEGEGDDKLILETSDLGLYVIKSPRVSRVHHCSPCCPNAGDLDTPGDSVTAYDLPVGWRVGEPDA